MSRFIYTIDENNAISMFDTENPIETGAPFLWQPHNTIDGTPFLSKEEATAWAEEKIAELLNPPVEESTAPVK